MKALHFDGQNLELTGKKVPTLQQNEALIRVLYVGICNTDIEITRGYMDYSGTLGHEFVGVVEKAGNPGFLGKRVCGEINLACGNCNFCFRGLGNHCPNRTVLGISGKDGCMAEYVTLPEKNLHILPEQISDTEAVFVEPLAAASRIPEQMEILPEYRILILGDGKLAQLIAQVLWLYNENLLVVGKHSAKLDLLKQQGIAARKLADFDTPDQSFDLVVEAAGSWDAWNLALAKVKPRGYLVLKSTYAGSNQFNPAPLVINEVNIIGSRCGPFTSAIQLLQKGAIQVENLISGIYPLEKWEAAFSEAKKPESLKILIEL